jgi:uncharacterized protein YbjT (DUF2867 family)
MKIVIGGATGNIGRRVAKKVVAAGHEAVLLGRNVAGLQQLDLPNATLAAVDMRDGAQVVAQTKGADALFWVVPQNVEVPSLREWHDHIIAAGVAAIQENGIGRVVAVSAVGAGAAGNLGTVSYAGHLEKAFKAVARNVVFLRPGYFMENFLAQRADILQKGYFSFPYAPDHDIPFISTDDIGDVAADYLTDATWAGQWARTLMGPRNLTPPEAAAIFSRALKRSIRYRQVPLHEMKEQFAQLGANQTVQQELVHLLVALGDPDGVYATARTEEVYTTTTLEEMIRSKFMPAS